LKERSHIIVDKVTAIPTGKIAQKIGKADAQTMFRVKTALAILFDLS
jgi:mRNA-degrading endonuclease toxin of MazEF toxin-antitoxin module